MKTQNAILLFMSIVSFISTAQASGDSKGNGGRVYVCRDHEGKITSVELLDLWRGKRPIIMLPDGTMDMVRGGLGLNIPNRNEDAAIQYMYAEKLLPVNSYGAYSLRKYFSTARKAVTNATFGASGVPLPLIHDIGPEPMLDPVTDRGCGLEQLAIFTQGNSLILQPELYEAIQKQPTSLAAFFSHESIYKTSDEKNSLRVQALVAHSYANPVSQEMIASLTKQVFRLQFQASFDPNPPRDQWSLDLPSSLADKVDPNSTELLTLHIKNTGGYFSRSHNGLVFGPWYRGFRTKVEVIDANSKTFEITEFELSDTEVPQVVTIPFEARGLWGATIRFNIFYDYDRKKYPSAEVILYQGSKVLGRWTTDELGKYKKGIQQIQSGFLIQSPPGVVSKPLKVPVVDLNIPQSEEEVQLLKKAKELKAKSDQLKAELAALGVNLAQQIPTGELKEELDECQMEAWKEVSRIANEHYPDVTLDKINMIPDTGDAEHASYYIQVWITGSAHKALYRADVPHNERGQCILAEKPKVKFIKEIQAK